MILDPRDVRAALHHSKVEVALRGHTWDVADIMDALDGCASGLTYEQFWEVMELAEQAGWVSGAVCGIHDGLPFTEEEDAELCEGFDPCIPIVRLWDGPGSEDPSSRSLT